MAHAFSGLRKTRLVKEKVPYYPIFMKKPGLDFHKIVLAGMDLRQDNNCFPIECINN